MDDHPKHYINPSDVILEQSESQESSLISTIDFVWKDIINYLSNIPFIHLYTSSMPCRKLALSPIQYYIHCYSWTRSLTKYKHTTSQLRISLSTLYRPWNPTFLYNFLKGKFLLKLNLFPTSWCANTMREWNKIWLGHSTR